MFIDSWAFFAFPPYLRHPGNGRFLAFLSFFLAISRFSANRPRGMSWWNGTGWASTGCPSCRTCYARRRTSAYTNESHWSAAADCSSSWRHPSHCRPWISESISWTGHYGFSHSHRRLSILLWCDSRMPSVATLGDGISYKWKAPQTGSLFRELSMFHRVWWSFFSGTRECDLHVATIPRLQDRSWVLPFTSTTILSQLLFVPGFQFYCAKRDFLPFKP